MTQHELKEEIIKAVEANHIWINSFQLINPNDEICLSIGRTIVEMLKKKENLLPLYFEDSENEVTKAQKITPILYLSVNQS